MLIYSDRRYLPEGQPHVVMLAPFWGKNPEVDDPCAGRFDRYAATGKKYLRMVSLEEADLAVLPGEWLSQDPNPLAYTLASEASRRLGKRMVVFFNNDSAENIPIENSVVFRTSFYLSKRKANEFALPAWSEDLLERFSGSELCLRPYKSRPVVGYCGYSMNLKARLKHELGRLPHFARVFLAHLGVCPSLSPHRYLRWQSLMALASSKDVETNFIIRQTFWNGMLGKDGKVNKALALQSRREFAQNILDSDYVLCVRGNGNFSYRLYETLSLGRIPVFVNTDCVLPCDQWIDWKQYVVWVDQNEVDRIAERVAAFHASLGPSAFAELQRACRQLWGEWLSPQGYFANFYRHFDLHG